MRVLENVREALSGIAVFEGQQPPYGEVPLYEEIIIGEGKYPAIEGLCAKFLYTGKEKPIRFFGGNDSIEVETFKIIAKGESYFQIENILNLIKTALSGTGFLLMGGYTDIEPKENEDFLQLALEFKMITKITDSEKN